MKEKRQIEIGDNLGCLGLALIVGLVFLGLVFIIATHPGN